MSFVKLFNIERERGSDMIKQPPPTVSPDPPAARGGREEGRAVEWVRSWPPFHEQ
jgi:hypothetical protein